MSKGNPVSLYQHLEEEEEEMGRKGGQRGKGREEKGDRKRWVRSEIRMRRVSEEEEEGLVSICVLP